MYCTVLFVLFIPIEIMYYTCGKYINEANENILLKFFECYRSVLIKNVL